MLHDIGNILLVVVTGLLILDFLCACALGIILYQDWKLYHETNAEIRPNA